MRVHVKDQIYYDFESGTFYVRPEINGRRTWRAINADSIEEALAVISGVKVETVKELIDRYIAAGVPTKLGGRRMSKREEVADLKRIAAQGLTILIIDHDMTLVSEAAQHITVLNFGRRIADGESMAVLRHPDVVSAYLGSE